ncbi:hypothetical protein CCMA1212_005861 [Trichoderma ghanense]|uniref:Cytochrome c oxidase subunit 6, mitochondrial n=1 Tax=Trichoderma ghanense TaxID=65468 RepID=A0ABY2H2L4_9HYPO
MPPSDDFSMVLLPKSPLLQAIGPESSLNTKKDNTNVFSGPQLLLSPKAFFAFSPAFSLDTMQSAALLRAAARGSSMLRASAVRPAPFAARSAIAAARPFSVSASRRAEHAEETFEEFTARFEKEFDAVQDVFELQRNLNNAFAYDLVPSPSVVAAALKAARRVNDFATAVRIFEGIKAKVENKNQYQQYLDELKPLREELGVSLKEDLYPEEK